MKPSNRGQAGAREKASELIIRQLLCSLQSGPEAAQVRARVGTARARTYLALRIEARASRRTYWVLVIRQLGRDGALADDLELI